ncbi:MAG: PEGA domain-containing protein [Mariniphaga sp.]
MLTIAILFSGCASTTLIQSLPGEAKVYIDGQPVGKTPYTHTDTKILGSTTMVKLEKEGFEDLNTSFSRTEQVDVGAIIGGLFFWIPFLWTMKYNPMHTYELMPNSKHEQSVVKTAPTQDIQSSSKIEKLRELKQLLDEDIITQEEFEKEKTKILETQ